MCKRVIEVLDYDPAWPELFEVERGLLGDVLGRIATRIHHIGSAAVPGLAAKPIIDILIEVTSLADLDGHSEEMSGLGYAAKGEFGIAGRRYFQKDGYQRTHQVHAFAAGDSNILRHIAFRDYLRANPEIAREYGQLKKEIAAACGNDIGRYCDGKDAYVKRLEVVALQETAPNQPFEWTGDDAGHST